MSAFASAQSRAACHASRPSMTNYAVHRPVTCSLRHGAAPFAGRLSAARRSNSRRFTITAAVVDEATKISFPDEVEGLKCLGAGVREKKIAFIGVKVYSVGLYVDAAGMTAALSEGNFFNPLLESPVDKLLSIRFARQVDGEEFWKALQEAVTPRISQIATDQATAEDEDGNYMSEVAEAAEVKEEAALEQQQLLGDFLGGGGALKAGDEVTLRWQCDGTLVAGRNATTKAFPSAELAQALFDVYVGSDPVAPPALEAFQAGLQSL